MSAHREVEISCNGPNGNNFECVQSTPFFARTATRARSDARNAGWLVNQPGGKDYCPAHRPARRPAEGLPVSSVEEAKP